MPIAITTALPGLQELRLAGMGNDLRAEWNPDVPDRGSVRLEARETGTSTWTHSASATVADGEAVVTGLSADVEYEVRGRVRTEDAASEWMSERLTTLYLPIIDRVGRAIQSSTPQSSAVQQSAVDGAAAVTSSYQVPTSHD